MTEPVRRSLRGIPKHDARRVLRDAGILLASELMILENAETFLAFGKGPFPENAIGHYPLHFCVADHLVVNRVPRLVAMATEETSVVAGLCKAAKIGAASGGITVNVSKRNAVRGQILFHNVLRPEIKVQQLEEYGDRYIREAHRTWDPMVKHGGGLLALHPKLVLDSRGKPTVAVDIEADTGEAMGANIITFMGDRLAHDMQHLVQPISHTSICSNHRSGWHVVAQGAWDFGSEYGVVAKMMDLQAFAEQDRSRAVTHNKGILNGVSGVATATGNDVRAMEACLHGQAALHGGIRPLTHLENRMGAVVRGTLEVTLPIGMVGGATGEPIARIARKIMRVTTARDLAGIMAAVGLTQNVAALRMLAKEGVAGSHRRLRGGK
jgi:hydroxymethylglutaryl-CoA reductase